MVCIGMYGSMYFGMHWYVLTWCLWFLLVCIFIWYVLYVLVCIGYIIGRMYSKFM